MIYGQTSQGGTKGLKDNQTILEIAVKAADTKKALDLEVINLIGLSSIADYFLIVSGSNDRQVSAITMEIEDKLAEAGVEPKHKEGIRGGRWIVLDYGDIIVHVFHQEERDFYGLEKIWAEGERVDLSAWI
jgi:ribosome-associated protein